MVEKIIIREDRNKLVARLLFSIIFVLIILISGCMESDINTKKSGRSDSDNETLALTQVTQETTTMLSTIPTTSTSSTTIATSFNDIVGSKNVIILSPVNGSNIPIMKNSVGFFVEVINYGNLTSKNLQLHAETGMGKVLVVEPANFDISANDKVKLMVKTTMNDIGHDNETIKVWIEGSNIVRINTHINMTAPSRGRCTLC